MKEHPDDADKIMKLVTEASEVDSKNPFWIYLRLAANFGQPFELSDGSTQNVEDCLAAVAYFHLQFKN